MTLPCGTMRNFSCSPELWAAGGKQTQNLLPHTTSSTKCYHLRLGCGHNGGLNRSYQPLHRRQAQGSPQKFPATITGGPTEKYSDRRGRRGTQPKNVPTRRNSAADTVEAGRRQGGQRNYRRNIRGKGGRNLQCIQQKEEKDAAHARATRECRG